MAQQVEEKSELALAIEQRERKLYEFDVQGFFSLGSEKIHRIGIRVAVKAEEDAALVAAHTEVNRATDLKEAREDFDLIGDQKLIQILYRICFSTTEKTSAGVPYSAFPSPSWMKQNLTTDQIACLMNLYHEARHKDGPTRWEIDTARVEALATGIASTASTDLPEAMLADMDRTWLTHAFVLLACRWKALHDVSIVRHDEHEGDAPEPEGGSEEDPADDDL